MTRRFALPLLVLSLLVGSVVSAAPAVAGAYQPDSMVKKGGFSDDPNDYVGFGVYNTSGAGQKVTKRTRAGKTVIFTLVAFNAGSVTDDLRLTGCGNWWHFKVRYFGDDSIFSPERLAAPSPENLKAPEPRGLVDITDEIVAGTAIIYGVTPLAGWAITAHVTVRRNTASRSWRSCGLDVESDIGGGGWGRAILEVEVK